MRLLFIANVDWFFQSHFLYLAERARDRGWDVALATHVGRAREALVDAGITLIDLPTRRGEFSPSGYRQASAIVARELRRQPDTIVHGFGLFGILVGGLAGRQSGCRRSVYTITGRGYSAAANSLKARAVRGGAKFICGTIIDGPEVRWLAENNQDFAECGLLDAVAQSRTELVGGAGVDPEHLSLQPMPPRPPFRAALVARMIWSKGIDVAVEAVGIARRQGVDIELTLAGALDQDNPKALTVEQLRAFEKTGGVRWIGYANDINTLWAEHHIAVLPSRGGEGLPRSLIEAAACGRPIVTTDVPGCGAFAAETGGWCVRPGDAGALADALIVASQHAKLEGLGRGAREVVLRSYTQDHNWGIVERFYEELGVRDAGHAGRWTARRLGGNGGGSGSR